MLANLPTELLILIAENIPCQADIYHLAVTSRRISNVLLPFLYSDVTLCGSDPDSSACRSLQVPCFFNSIIRHPEYAKAVNSLNLKCWKYQWDYFGDGYGYTWVGLPDKSTFTYDVDTIGPMVSKAKMTEQKREQWTEDIECGIEDAWLALIVPQLTQVRRLQITWPSNFFLGDPEGWLLRMLERAALEGTPVFPHLEEAQFGWYALGLTLSSNTLLPFFKFPSMRKLTASCVEDDTPPPNPDAPIVPTSGITEIVLCHSNYTSLGLRGWVAACKALKAFSFEYDGRPKKEDFFNPEPVVQSLLLHKATLESIHIRSPKEPHTIFESEGEAAKIESFAEFTVLKHLNIGVDDLVEMTSPEDLRDTLPSSLETLHLDCLNEELFHMTVLQLEKLVAWRCMPKLACLTVEACRRPRIPDDALRAELKGLRTRCEEAGISLQAFNRGWVYTLSSPC